MRFDWYPSITIMTFDRQVWDKYEKPMQTREVVEIFGKTYFVVEMNWSRELPAEETKYYIRFQEVIKTPAQVGVGGPTVSGE